MIRQVHVCFLVAVTSFLLSCGGQTTPNVIHKAEENGVVGGPFENGDFMYIGMPENIKSVDTSVGWSQKGQKLVITGTIYKQDGRTPAPNVILYYYHTDINGVYADRQGLDPRVVRHGYIRGWVKSDANGKYAIYTVRPAPYPGRKVEAHIHPTIKEPTIEKEYYIDEFVFDDDSLLTGAKRKRLENRGGSGVLRVYTKDSLQVAAHNIILGLNIPNYPGTVSAEPQSGLHIGEDQPSFGPYHAFGPDKGAKTCPVCKYGRYLGILYFVGNKPNWDESKKWLTFLEQQSVERGKLLKVYFVYGNNHDYSKQRRQDQLEKIGNELKLKNVALTFVPSFSDTESDIHLSRINPDLENTFILYRNTTIMDKQINLKPTIENFELVAKELDKMEEPIRQVPG